MIIISVKKKDRHLSMSDPVQKARNLTEQALFLTRPREFDNHGKQIRKPGILAEGQPFYAFGSDILTLSKRIHAKTYAAWKIRLKDNTSLTDRTKLHQDALEYCDSILRLLDLCIFEYGRTNKKKMKSFNYMSRLTYTTKESIQDRINRDNLIIQQKFESPKRYRRGR